MPRSFPVQTLSQEVAKKTSTTEVVYTIPSGKRLRVERFFGGHEYSTQEARVELLLRAGSDSLICVGYGCCFQYALGREYLGDGEKQIVIKMVNQTPGALHMTGIWEGLEEDG